VNPAPRAVLVPPRPNLGPDPIPGPSSTPALVLVALLLALAAWRGVRWVRRRRLRGGRAAHPIMPDIPAGSPRDRLIAGSEAVREALAARFGPAWGAKTTEELADRPELADRLGAERTARLVALLEAADRAKFADPDGLDLPEAGPDSGWLAEIARELRASGE
jgi:hypothetical protein